MMDPHKTNPPVKVQIYEALREDPRRFVYAKPEHCFRRQVDPGEWSDAIIGIGARRDPSASS